MGISDDIIKQIQDAVNGAIQPNTLRVAASELVQSIKKRTRLGKGLQKDGDSLQSLTPLVSSYKKQRKRLNLSSETTPAKSNLTQTGKMVDNIDFKVTSTGFEVFIKGQENNKKAEYVSKKRPFMFLAKFEIKVLIENLVAGIIRATKR